MCVHSLYCIFFICLGLAFTVLDVFLNGLKSLWRVEPDEEWELSETVAEFDKDQEPSNTVAESDEGKEPGDTHESESSACNMDKPQGIEYTNQDKLHSGQKATVWCLKIST